MTRVIVVVPKEQGEYMLVNIPVCPVYFAAPCLKVEAVKMLSYGNFAIPQC